MEVLRSFVIRVYRQDAAEIAGVLQLVETGEMFSFRTAEELYAHLSTQISCHGSCCHDPDHAQD